MSRLRRGKAIAITRAAPVPCPDAVSGEDCCEGKSRVGTADEHTTDVTDLFRLMVDSVRDYAMFILSPEGVILTWNPGAEAIKGYRADEIVGRHFSVFYPAADVRAGKPEYELRVATEAGRFEDEDWRIRKDGSRFWANVVITAIKAPSGRILGFGKVTRDLSERKRGELEREVLLEAERTAREQAEAAQNRLEALQRVTETTLAHVTVDRLSEALVEQVEQVFAADEVALLLEDDGERRVLAERGKSADSFRAVRQGVIDRVIDEHTAILVHEGLESAPGQRVAGSWLGVPMRSENRLRGALYVASRLPGRFREDDLSLLRMIGDRVSLSLEHARAVEAEREARVQVEAAQRSTQVRNEFISVAAHELKSPLTSIRMAAQMAAKRLGEGDPIMHTLMGQVVAQAGRMNRLVVALLDSSRVDLGRLQIEPVQADVGAMVSEVVENTRQTSDREITLESDDQVIAEVDPLRFEQVTMNLLDNAVKYSPNGTPVEVTLTCEVDRFVLVVRDYGPGIPTALRERVFERYFQGHADNQRSGLGLGLYITREIVNAHGGEITAEFPSDGGSRFIVRMPFACATVADTEH